MRHPYHAGQRPCPRAAGPSNASHDRTGRACGHFLAPGARMSDAPRTAPDPGAPPTIVGARRNVIMGGLLLVLLLASLDSTVVATALPTIAGQFGGLDRIGWVVTAYLLAQTVSTPLYGKLGDLYGRKRVLQAAVLLFLAGSALCGQARSMNELVAFRGFQGLGGGGLMVVTQAAVGDVIPPRERGRYQGLFGAVFGASSIAGPLIGGYFTTHLSWRWIFYVNLPLGAVALAVLARALPDAGARTRRVIDYAGSALLAVALSALVLITDLGGRAAEWTSPTVVGLGLAAVASLALFVVAERRAAEPVLPFRLFRDRTFAVAAGVGLIVGFALFGSVTYLPLYLQGVQGASPTRSGLLMLPMMAGMLVTSIVSGRRITATGRYRVYPIVGTALMTLGLAFLARLRVDTSEFEMLGLLLVLGLGLGMVMQVLVIAVQNAVARADLGVATSGTTLFRLVGGSLGTAVLGTVFAARAALGPGGGMAGSLGRGVTAAALSRLTPAARAAATTAITDALSAVFLVAAVVAAVGFALALLLPDRALAPVAAGPAAERVGEGEPAAEHAASFA